MMFLYINHTKTHQCKLYTHTKTNQIKIKLLIIKYLKK